MEREIQAGSGESPQGERMGMTRREAIGTVLKAGAAALPLTMASAFAGAQVAPPTNLRTSKPVLKPTDLKFSGFYRFPTETGDLWYARHSLASRRVGGELRLFTIGNAPANNGNPLLGNSPLFEMAVPSLGPSTTIDVAPRLTFRRNWGQVSAGRTVASGSGVGQLGGLCWDPGLNGLWWSYGDPYVPTQSHPTLGFTQINDNTGAFTSYGPWRTQWHCQRTRGPLTVIPDTFADRFLGGKRIGVMAGQHSGNVQSPFGCNLSALGLPNPLTAPPDVLNSTNWTVANQGLILHDLQHRQARDTNYKVCGWSSPGQQQHYDCRISNYIMPGTPEWGGPVPAVGENDSINGGTWIDLPDKHGMFYFGHLVTTPTGYRAPGDPDGFVHMWYGDPEHASHSGSLAAGFTNNSCCHGQDDKFWGATGPGAHYRVPMAWIYDPGDFIATAGGMSSLWSRTPTSTFQWRQPQMAERYSGRMFAGSIFDAAERRLYVVLRSVDPTYGLYPRAGLMVFDIL